MKILIDNDPLNENLTGLPTFAKFCEKIMGLLLARNRSIGSCELDGTLITNIHEADLLFPNCQVCRIASVPLAVALKSALGAKRQDGRRLEKECEEMVTEVLLGDPKDIADRWESICDELKAQVGFLPRLAGLLTEAELNRLADRELKELASVMQTLHEAFEKGDTLEISDSIELRLLPWLRSQQAFIENCLQLAGKLRS